MATASATTHSPARLSFGRGPVDILRGTRGLRRTVWLLIRDRLARLRCSNALRAPSPAPAYPPPSLRQDRRSGLNAPPAA